MRTQVKSPSAHKHGFRTGALHLLPGETREEFELLHEEHRRHLQPKSEIEEASVRRLAVTDWQLRRLVGKEQDFSNTRLEEELKKTSEWKTFDALDGISMVLRHLFAKACELTGAELRWEEISNLVGILNQLVVVLGQQLEQNHTLLDAIAPLGLLTYQLPKRGDDDLDADITSVGDFGDNLRSTISRVTPLVAAAHDTAEKQLATKRSELSIRLLMPDGKMARLLTRYRTSLEKQRERELAYLHELVEMRVLLSIGSRNTAH